MGLGNGDEQRGLRTADHRDGFRLGDVGNGLPSVAHAKRGVQGQPLRLARVVEIVADRIHLERTDALGTQRLASANDLEAVRELVRQRRFASPRRRQPPAPLTLRLARISRQRHDESGDRFVGGAEVEQTFAAPGENRQGAGHDPSALLLPRIVHEQGTALDLSRDRTAQGAEPDIRSRESIRCRRTLRRPANLGQEEELFAVDLRRDIGEHPRGTTDDGQENGHCAGRHAERSDESRLRPSRFDARHDEPDQETGDQSDEGHADHEEAGAAFE